MINHWEVHCFNFLQREISVSVDVRASLRDLRDRISRQLRIPEKRLVLMSVNPESGITELSDDSLPIEETISDDHVIHAVETSYPKPEDTDVLDIVAVNRDAETRQVIGPFFQSCISRSSSFFKIQLELLQSLTSYLNNSLDVARLASEFTVKVIIDNDQCYQLSPDVDHPLYMPNVDKAISMCEKNGYRGPVHLNLILDWNSEVKERVFSDARISPARSPHISALTHPDSKPGVSIYDCLDLYFREERLQDENAWLCPSCQKRTASTKKLTLWTLPDLLVIHLKRFRQSSTMRSKLSTPVSYPLTGLDMSPFMDDRSESLNGSQSAISRWGSRLSSARVRSRSVGRESNSLPSRWAQPWKRPDLRCNQFDCDSRCSTYDLVAVCNHSGSLLSGHYTAVCRNPTNLQWYHYDDTAVSPVAESDVNSSNAYLLFYQRCSLSPTNSCDSAYLSSASHDSRQQTTDRPNRWSSFRNTSSPYQNLVTVDKNGSRYSRSRDDVRGSFPYATIPPAKTTRSIYKLLFRKKDRDISMIRDHVRDRDRNREKHPEHRLLSDSRTTGLTVILPPEELPVSQKSDKSNCYHRDDESVEKKKSPDDGLLWTVTSV